jgi:hypothetical protein
VKQETDTYTKNSWFVGFLVSSLPEESNKPEVQQFTCRGLVSCSTAEANRYRPRLRGAAECGQLVTSFPKPDAAALDAGSRSLGACGRDSRHRRFRPSHPFECDLVGRMLALELVE